MTPAMIHDPLARLLDRLDRLGQDELPDAVHAEVMETGGTWLCPGAPGALRNTSHMVEIALHGITGRGPDTASAIDDWRAAARRTLTEQEA